MKNLFRKIAAFLFMTLLMLVGGCTSGSNDAENPSTSNQQETETVDEHGTEATSEDANKDEEIVITVGTPAQYAPWIYTDDNNEVVGLENEILTEALSRMEGNYTLEYNITDFDGMFAGLDSGINDIAATQISVTPEREKKYRFSTPFAYNPLKLVVKEENAEEIQSLEDLKGRTITGNATGIAAEIIENYKNDNDPNDEIKFEPTGGDNMLAVETGQADAFIVAEPYVQNYVKESGADLVSVGEPLYVEVNAYPFSDDVSDEFIEEFNAALESMIEDGFLSDLYMEAFGIDLTEEVEPVN